MDEIEHFFKSQFNKTKIAPSGTQLLLKAKEKKLHHIKPKDIYTFKRERAGLVSSFATPRKTKYFQTIGVPRSGIYFIDYGEFLKKWSWHNNGCTGFLVAVENLTNKLFILPTKGKDTQQWLDSIQQFVELTRDVCVILSDRDSVANSKTFRDHIQQQYGIKWHFLRKGNKSYLAERAIRTVKTLLSQGLLKMSSEQNGEQVKKWIDLIPALCESYNSQKILNTSYTRRSVHRDNFLHFLSQLLGYKESDLELKFNDAKMSEFANDKWNAIVFKFKVGDSVRVLRKAIWNKEFASEASKGLFDKPSMKGSFTGSLFKITGRQLRVVKNRKRLIPMYSLEGLGPYFNFYENELVKAV